MRIAHDGIELAVEVEGDEGPPVVFVHGGADSARTFRWLPESVTAGRQILRPDLRGHGDSDHAPGPYTLGRYGADVVEVVRQCADRPVVLVGHSLGGAVAWWVAQHHPELVTAMFLEDPGLFLNAEGRSKTPQEEFVPQLRDEGVEMRKAGLTTEQAAEQIGTLEIQPGLTVADVLEPSALLTQAWARMQVDPEVLTAVEDGTTLGPAPDGQVSCPVLILAAGIEPAFTVEDERQLAATHPHVKVVRLPDAGHDIHDTRATRGTYLRHLESFLREHAPATVLA